MNTFSIGTVLSSGFKIWARNILPFMLLTLLIYAPVIIWGVMATRGDNTAETALALKHFINYGGYAGAFMNVLVSSALTYGVVMELQGTRASFGACVMTGLARFFPTLGVGLLAMLAIGGATLLLFVPGMIVMCMLYVVTPASVIERPGIMGALRRSRLLTDGNKMQIFGLIMIIGLLGGAVGIAMGVLMVSAHGDREAMLAASRTIVYLQMVSHVVLGSIGSVMAAVAYYYLRLEKEGTSAQELAAVFE